MSSPRLTPELPSPARAGEGSLVVETGDVVTTAEAGAPLAREAGEGLGERARAARPYVALAARSVAVIPPTNSSNANAETARDVCTPTTLPARPTVKPLKDRMPSADML